MSRSLETMLDATLDMRQQRWLQHQAAQTHAQQVIDAAHAKVEREQTRFHTEVRSLIRQSIERANRHLIKRPEHCEFHDVSGYYAGSVYVCGSTCNPIAYQLHTDGAAVGEALLVELTHEGTVEASLSLLPASGHDAQMPRIELGWHPVRLESFTAATAAHLVVAYVAAITKRWSLGCHIPSDLPASVATGDAAGVSSSRG
jgi:hypothetical protein